MAEIRVTVNFEAVKRQLGLLGAVLRDRRGLLETIADWLRFISRQSFQRQGSPEGAPWAPLSLRYAFFKARRFRGQGILRRRGVLLRSLFSGVEGNRAFVSTTPLPYAAIHQFGGQAGRGRKARIPARPYLPSAALVEREATEIVKEHLLRALEKGK